MQAWILYYPRLNKSSWGLLLPLGSARWPTRGRPVLRLVARHVVHGLDAPPPVAAGLGDEAISFFFSFFFSDVVARRRRRVEREREREIQRKQPQPVERRSLFLSEPARRYRTFILFIFLFITDKYTLRLNTNTGQGSSKFGKLGNKYIHADVSYVVLYCTCVLFRSWACVR